MIMKNLASIIVAVTSTVCATIIVCTRPDAQEFAGGVAFFGFMTAYFISD